jgi:FAD/FMN-containing dehydrogenase
MTPMNHVPGFEELQNHIQGDIILPTDPEYQESIKRWSKLAEKPAGAVIFVRNDEDVSAVMKFAVNNDIDIAIKG